jgi:hypothetical protein
MEKVSGTVSNLRNTINVSGGGENNQVTTTHISIFQLTGRQIKAKSSEPLMINEGDKLIVAGSTQKGVLNSYAHKNLTTNIEGNEGWILRLIFGLIMPCVGIGAMAAFADNSNSFGMYSEPLIFRMLPKFVGGFFIVFGIYNIFCAARVLQAIKELRQEVT